jgi:hypothetical protein
VILWLKASQAQAQAQAQAQTQTQTQTLGSWDQGGDLN